MPTICQLLEQPNNHTAGVPATVVVSEVRFSQTGMRPKLPLTRSHGAAGQINLGNSARIQFYDRSPICTLALANWLGHPLSDALRFEIERIRRENVYRSEVFFVRNLGFMKPAEARRISLADSIRFGELHEETYLAQGFKLIYLDTVSAFQRVKSIKLSVGNLREPSFPFHDMDHHA